MFRNQFDDDYDASAEYYESEIERAERAERRAERAERMRRREARKAKGTH